MALRSVRVYTRSTSRSSTCSIALTTASRSSGLIRPEVSFPLCHVLHHFPVVLTLSLRGHLSNQLRETWRTRFTRLLLCQVLQVVVEAGFLEALAQEAGNAGVSAGADA